MIICAEAPAKMILFGEHFVVLGKPAIVNAINLYARTCIWENASSDSLIIYSKNLGYTYSYGSNSIPEPLKPFHRIVEYVLEHYSLSKPPSLYIEIDSEIPVGAGLGSSAASAVSFTVALLKSLGIEVEPDIVSKIAFEAEKIVHGKPSGIDNTIATYGGFLYYRKGVIKKLLIEWPQEYEFLVADTGRKRNTGIVVREVLDRYQRRKNIMSRIYDVAEEIVETAIECLVKKDIDCLCELLNINHGLLVSIGVAVPETEIIVHKALETGACAAKITGAGKGGSVIILSHKNMVHKIIDAIKKHVHAIYNVRPVFKGYRVYYRTK